MIRFTSIASSSKGNAYLAETPGVAPLLLEAGLPIKALREKLNFGISNLAGCVVSHEHMDHAKAVKDLLKAGTNCGMSQGTAEALGVEGHYRVERFLRTEKGYHTVGISGWSVTPFPLAHDAAEPTGFLIAHGDDRLLFVPDTAYVENRFAGITIAAVECNNVESILSENIINGTIDASVGRRVRRNHMSLENLVTMLKANDLAKCREIFLLHLSDNNSNEVMMKTTVQASTGIPVTVC